MTTHLNFYENVKEANMRLKGTVVLYDEVPHFLFAISDHRNDGIFRAYMHPLPLDFSRHPYPLPPEAESYPSDSPDLGKAMDKWMEANPNSPIIRKHLSSPKFNKFRPYPLGMCNVGKECFYIERQPQRRTEQGLTKNMLYYHPINTAAVSGDRSLTRGIDLFSEEFRRCILGELPSPQETLAALLDPEVENTAVAFHRQFALVRGPMELLFMAHKGDVVGLLPDSNFSRVRLGRKFSHLVEVVSELGLFTTVES